MSNDFYGFTSLEKRWQYKQVLTFSGTPFVLFEEIELLSPDDTYGDPQRDSVQQVPTGEMKLEALEEVVTNGSKKALVESIK